MYDLYRFPVQQESLDHCVADADCGVLNALKDSPSVGWAAVEWVGAESQQPAQGKAVVSEPTCDGLCMRLLQVLHVLTYL